MPAECCNHAYSCFLTPILLPADHDINRFVAFSFSFTVVIFPSFYRILYRVDDVKIDNTTCS